MEDQEKQESKENQKPQRTYIYGKIASKGTAWPNEPKFTKDELTDEEIDEFLRKLFPNVTIPLTWERDQIKFYQENFGPLTGLSYEDIADSVTAF